VELHGVARKTANVVLGTAYRIASGIVVDTHVTRVAQRLGLSQAQTPEKIEQELCALLPQGEWIDGGHRLLLHGRYVCLAQGPKCTQCPLHELCPARAVARPASGPSGRRGSRRWSVRAAACWNTAAPRRERGALRQRAAWSSRAPNAASSMSASLRTLMWRTYCPAPSSRPRGSVSAAPWMKPNCT